MKGGWLVQLFTALWICSVVNFPNKSVDLSVACNKG